MIPLWRTWLIRVRWCFDVGFCRVGIIKTPVSCAVLCYSFNEVGDAVKP